MSDGLRDRAIGSAKWVAAGRVVAEATSFAALLALARLLTPAEIGHAAVAMVAFALAGGFLGGSFGSPLIKEPTIRDAQVEVATLLSIASGAALTVACCLAALGLSLVLDHTSAAMVALASPCFLFASVAVVPQALRSRRLAFRAITAIEIAGSVAGSGVAVGLAVLGAGPEAMVLGAVAGMAVAAVLSLVRTDARRPRWHRDEVRAILSFGLPASASSIFFTAVRNVDYALLSARLPAAQVGFYYRAYTLAVDYQTKISTIVVRILFPLLARTDSPAAFRAVRRRVVQLHSVVLFPLLGTLLVTAPDAVPLLYGEQWREAITPVQILVGAGIATAVGTGIGPVMLAAGHPRALLLNNVISFACFALVVYVAAGYGLIAACIGVVAYRLVALAVSQYLLATRLLGIPLHHTLVLDPGPAAVSTAALLAAAFPISALLAPAPAAISVALTAAAGLCAYALVLRALFGAVWKDVRTAAAAMVPQRLRAGRTGIRPRLREEG